MALFRTNPYTPIHVQAQGNKANSNARTTKRREPLYRIFSLEIKILVRTSREFPLHILIRDLYNTPGF